MPGPPDITRPTMDGCLFSQETISRIRRGSPTPSTDAAFNIVHAVARDLETTVKFEHIDIMQIDGEPTHSIHASVDAMFWPLELASERERGKGWRGQIALSRAPGECKTYQQRITGDHKGAAPDWRSARHDWRTAARCKPSSSERSAGFESGVNKHVGHL